MNTLHCDDVNVTDDKEVPRDWDFPFIHRTVDSDGGCLEANVIMVYCAAFDYNANSSKDRAKCSWFKFPTEPTLSKTSKLQTDEAQPALLARKKTCFDCDPDQRRRSPGLSCC